MNSTVRQLVESSARFPLAMFAFGMRQGTRVLTAGRGAKQEAEASFYVVGQAARRELSDLLLGGFQIGDAIQREIVDAMFRFVSPQSRGELGDDAGEALRSLLQLPHRNLRLAAQELRNKMQVFDLVRHVRGLLREPNTAQLPLMDLLHTAYSLPEFERIWAMEGLGHGYTAGFPEMGGSVSGILTGGQAAAVPSKALTMLHAGMGLAFAQTLWNGISPYDSEARVVGAIQRFERLCAANSMGGYGGAARESLGLATQTIEPLLVAAADRAIRASAPELTGYFWHGVGRALYFAATHFIPGLTSPWTGILRRSTHREGVCNLIAGLAWATALVNMRQPRIVVDLVSNLDSRVLETGAFAHGITAALMMAYDVEPANPWIDVFLEYVPEEKRAAAMWSVYVAEPCRYVLARVYPDLKGRGRLEDLFHCVPGGGF